MKQSEPSWRKSSSVPHSATEQTALRRYRTRSARSWPSGPQPHSYRVRNGPPYSADHGRGKGTPRQSCQRAPRRRQLFPSGRPPHDDNRTCSPSAEPTARQKPGATSSYISTNFKASPRSRSLTYSANLVSTRSAPRSPTNICTSSIRTSDTQFSARPGSSSRFGSGRRIRRIGEGAPQQTRATRPDTVAEPLHLPETHDRRHFVDAIQHLHGLGKAQAHPPTSDRAPNPNRSLSPYTAACLRTPQSILFLKGVVL